ncbi:MAG: cupin domain-containing protein [Pseudomonadota bacterium]
MEVRSPAETPTRRGPAENFTGTVWLDSILETPEPATVRSYRVNFEPGARTAWHAHPKGQTLHVLSGVGRVQAWDGPLREIRAGDTVWIPPGEKHWHGASPTVAMIHVAIQESVDGSHSNWMEHVADDQYSKEPIR